ncbi:hypothetical protein BAURA86_02490 [Brevibacterium aurantiacum]|uniref:Uncharacterized protein n=1 Tax=Brevibacterium aurantiacum TaxID=273384 RepID=A0A2H1K7U1_BREAU|nr:hypothetical protein BAURA86_02490 [Brevibacterium aurantiacum]
MNNNLTPVKSEPDTWEVGSNTGAPTTIRPAEVTEDPADFMEGGSGCGCSGGSSLVIIF